MAPKVWAYVTFYLGLQWSPEQIAGKVAVSRGCVYLRVYADKATGSGDAVIGAARKQTMVTLAEHKSGFAVLPKVSNKMAVLAGELLGTSMMLGALPKWTMGVKSRTAS